MIKAAKALSIVLNSIKPKGAESVDMPLSLNRIISQDICARYNLPPFDNSAMDGYALKSKDTKGASRKHAKILKVIDSIPAGYISSNKIKSNEAMRIMTGAPLPKGADAVIMVEETKVTRHCEGAKRPKQSPSKEVASPLTSFGARNDTIAIFKEVKPGENVRYAGGDVKRGEKIIHKGDIIRPQELGMLAALGVSKVRVASRPKIGVIATGDELVGIKEKLAKGKIHNSNTYCLIGQILKSGGIPLDLGVVKDNCKDIYTRAAKGLKAGVDMLVISGGVSVGDYDFVKDALAPLGIKMKFCKVAMRPGKPVVFGLIKGVPVFGLPGNPVSIMVAFEEFVRPAVLLMQGAKRLFRPTVYAASTMNLEKRKGFRYYLRVSLKNEDGKFYASLAGPQGSGILKSMILADGIMVLPEDMKALKKGQAALVQLLG